MGCDTLPIRLVSLFLCFCLLCGCAAQNGDSPGGSEQPPDTSDPASTTPESSSTVPEEPPKEENPASTQPPEAPPETGSESSEEPPAEPPPPEEPPPEEKPPEEPAEPETKEAAPERASGTVLISFETPILDYSKGRITNIKLAIKKLNGCVIPSGETFSFNDTVGPRTMKRGFKKAVIFVDGEKVQELGGGICQVSSTIYNAVLDAGLEVVERHPHQLEVNYVPPDRDATVFYGRLDFKFRNNIEKDLRMEAKYTGKSVIIRLVIQ